MRAQNGPAAACMRSMPPVPWTQTFSRAASKHRCIREDVQKPKPRGGRSEAHAARRASTFGDWIRCARVCGGFLAVEKGYREGRAGAVGPCA